MKNLLLIFAALGMAFFVSCGSEELPKEEPPTLPEDRTVLYYWATCHYDLKVTIDNLWPYNDALLKELKDEIEQEVSADVSDEESYRLAFNDNGAGFGSRVRHGGTGRYDFTFTWTQSEYGPVWWEMEQSPNGFLSMQETPMEYVGIFSTWDGVPFESVDWKIEEFTADKLVLLHLDIREVDGWDVGATWTETHTYRYTFKKVNTCP